MSQEPAADDVRDGWKLLASDYCAPSVRERPLWDGRAPLPAELRHVDLDKVQPGHSCAGWHYCRDLATAVKIVGPWVKGPSVAFRVRVSADAGACQCGPGHYRASRMTLVRLATADEWREALRRPFVEHAFGCGVSSDVGVILEHQVAAVMAREQMAWHAALGRPVADPARVEADLAVALSARALPWSLRRHDRGEAVWRAREAWTRRDPLAAVNASKAWESDAREAALAAWHARATRRAQGARMSWGWCEDVVWQAGYGPPRLAEVVTWPRPRAVRFAELVATAWRAMQENRTEEAKAAWALVDDLVLIPASVGVKAAATALTIYYARRALGVPGEPDAHTRGLRNAYACGLALALPVGPRELGWAMQGAR